jgi:hypothetical protein
MSVDTSIISTEEMAIIIRQALKTGPKTTAELERIGEWAYQARIDAGLLHGVLAGQFELSVVDNEIRYSVPKGA